MNYHISQRHIPQSRQPARNVKRAQFVERCETFWCNHGQRTIDYAVIILVPTLIFAPAYVAWL